MFETFSAILKEHRAVIEMHIKLLKSILKDILNRGIDTKEFQIADIEKATSAVWDATQLLVN